MLQVLTDITKSAALKINFDHGICSKRPSHLHGTELTYSILQYKAGAAPELEPLSREVYAMNLVLTIITVYGSRRSLFAPLTKASFALNSIVNGDSNSNIFTLKSY